ncbi:hypothetical protein Ctob_002000 [Chrysochromulina tobinii]|uniref:ABC transmembrane type-1 domain-containing protein n=1 Tax=Chrysochromulina tobinii TaxID=1460289 RepID=A0A0M0JRY7_9EUKA|nr:hypothetical protein Ctob_002000 [Chrysochromulina tobinii]|eukprot:KOO29354.1 hypothetical protein Ctob_002000 [Chrysochromulina sp. CCMP291]
MRTSLIACKVTPGDKGCKIAMPGCSALEIKHCALAPGAPPDARCTLALDLATHNFVLCSLPPGGRMQATLSTVVTNDPDQMAWLFLKATGPRAFHVLGRLIVDSKERTGVAAANKAAWAAVREQRRRSGAPVSIGVGTGDGESDEDGWPTAADIAPSRTAGGKKPTAREAEDAQDDAEENIEVLLPEGDDRIEFESGAEDDPSEADSEEFPDDMPVVPRSVKAEPMLFASAEQHWAVELKRAKQKGSAPDLIRGVWLPSSPAALWMTIVLSVVSGLCNTVARPLLLRWTLLAIQDPDKYAMEAGMGFAAGLVVVLWIESWTRNYAVMEGSAIATARMMAGTMHLVGLKALHVAIGEGKASAEASIIGNDLVRTSQMMTIVPIMISGLASLAGGIAFLVFVDVGPIALAGLFVMVSILFVSFELGARSRKISHNILGAADKSVNALREMVDGAKVVKLQV